MMHKDHVGAVISFAIVAAIGIGLLYLGSKGSLPSGFGLFDMSNLAVRIVVIAVLAVVTLGLFLAYNSVRRK